MKSNLRSAQTVRNFERTKAFVWTSRGCNKAKKWNLESPLVNSSSIKMGKKYPSQLHTGRVMFSTIFCSNKSQKLFMLTKKMKNLGAGTRLYLVFFATFSKERNILITKIHLRILVIPFRAASVSDLLHWSAAGLRVTQLQPELSFSTLGPCASLKTAAELQHLFRPAFVWLPRFHIVSVFFLFWQTLTSDRNVLYK